MTRSRLLPDDRLQVAIDVVGDCPDAAFLVAREETIVAWNTAASELFGILVWSWGRRSRFTPGTLARRGQSRDLRSPRPGTDGR
jgi:hypothetical protein